MTRLAYRRELTDDQWKLLEPLIPSAKPGGRPRTLDLREVCNAIFYLLRNGCQWRDLPHDFPKWPSVYTYFRNWSREGTWQGMNDVLRSYGLKERFLSNSLLFNGAALVYMRGSSLALPVPPPVNTAKKLHYVCSVSLRCAAFAPLAPFRFY
jgi:putative transposase